MRSCIRFLAHSASLLLLLCCYFTTSEYTFRLRVHNGQMVRISLPDGSTFADLHKAIDKGGYFSDAATDTVKFATGSDSGYLLRSNCTKLSASMIGSGEVLQLQSAHSNPAAQQLRPVRSVAATIRKRTGVTKFASLADLKKRRGSMHRIVGAAAERNATTVHIGADAVSAAFARLPAGENSSLLDMYGGVALLLGARRNSSVHVCGAVEVGGPSPLSLADPADAAAARRSAAEFVTRQTLRMARLLGLQVVGCAVGSASSKTAPSRPAWSAEHVHAALFLRDQCLSYSGNSSAQVDPFVALSVGRQTTKGKALQELQLEAYQLNAQALEFHRTGVILNSSSGASSREILHLSAPVLVGGAQETSVLDPLLVAVPLPLVRAISGVKDAPALRHNSFPSLLELQGSADSAQGARAYLQRLLNALVGDTLDEAAPGARRAIVGVRGRVDALRDPQLLLYLALQLGDVAPADFPEGDVGRAEQAGEDSSPVAVLCRFLRDQSACADTGTAPPLPIEVAAVLDAARRSLQ